MTKNLFRKSVLTILCFASFDKTNKHLAVDESTASISSTTSTLPDGIPQANSQKEADNAGKLMKDSLEALSSFAQILSQKLDPKPLWADQAQWEIAENSDDETKITAARFPAYFGPNKTSYINQMLAVIGTRFMHAALAKALGTMVKSIAQTAGIYIPQEIKDLEKDSLESSQSFWTDNQDLEGSLTKLNKEIAAGTTAISAFSGELVKALEQQKEDLEAQLADARAESATAAQTLEELNRNRAQIAKLEELLKQIQAAVKTEANPQPDGFDKLPGHIENLLKSLEGQNQTLEQKLSKLSEEQKTMLDQHRAALRDATRANEADTRAAIEGAEANARQALANAAQSAKMVSQAQAQAKALEGILFQINQTLTSGPAQANFQDLPEVAKDLMAELTKLEDQLATLRDLQGQLQSLRTENERLKEGFKRKEVENNGLIESIKKLKERIADLWAQCTKNASLEKELDLANKENDDLASELKQAHQATEEANARAQAAEQAAKDATARAAASESALSTDGQAKAKELAAKTTEIARLEALIKELEAMAENHKKCARLAEEQKEHIEELTTEVGTLRAELARLQTPSAPPPPPVDLRPELDSTKAELEKAQEQLVTSRSIIGATGFKNVAARAKDQKPLADLQTQLDTAKAELETIRGELATAQRERATAEAKAKASLEAAKDASGQSSADLQAKEAELAGLKAKIAELQAKFDNLLKLLNALRGAVIGEIQTIENYVGNDPLIMGNEGAAKEATRHRKDSIEHQTCGDLENEKTALERQLQEQKANLEAQMAKLQTQIDSLNTSLASAQAELEEARKAPAIAEPEVVVEEPELSQTKIEEHARAWLSNFGNMVGKKQTLTNPDLDSFVDATDDQVAKSGLVKRLLTPDEIIKQATKKGASYTWISRLPKNYNLDMLNTATGPKTKLGQAIQSARDTRQTRKWLDGLKRNLENIAFVSQADKLARAINQTDEEIKGEMINSDSIQAQLANKDYNDPKLDTNKSYQKLKASLERIQKGITTKPNALQQAIEAARKPAPAA